VRRETDHSRERLSFVRTIQTVASALSEMKKVVIRG
jgi:hypothetical protein